MIRTQDPTRRACITETRRERGPIMAKMRYRSLMIAAIFAAFCLQTAKAADFIIINASGAVLYDLYIAPCNGPHWGPNQLAGFPVVTSRTFTISNIQPGCYDVKLLVPYWNECIVAGATLRGRTAWRITPMMLTNGVLGECSYIVHYVSGGQLPWARDPRW